MITADALARELGCTLSDLTEAGDTLHPEATLSNHLANAIRASWSKRTGIDYTENDLIRATTIAHRVKSIQPSDVAGVTELDCICGHRITSTAIVPEAARRRLYKTHALHVATCLMTMEADQ